MKRDKVASMQVLKAHVGCALFVALTACGSSNSATSGSGGVGGTGQANGGNSAVAGAATGGRNAANGGAATAGAANGGAANGGAATAGSANGGAPSGGAANGGSPNGGTATAGAANGGATNGGAANGGATNGGATNGGATNGGATNGGATNGGATNGGAMNGGATNGGATNGGATNGGAGGAGSTSPTQWVMGYYVGYAINQYPIAQIDWSGLTHIIFSPLTLKIDLSLDLSFSDQNGTGQQDAQQLSQAAHAHGVKALLMLGGAGAGANIATAASAAHRAAFVTALLSAVSTLGYDGIDLDWEDSVNLADLVALAQALRSAQPSLLLTYPAGAINGNYQTVDPLMVTLAASLDRFNVQTYYPSTAVTGQGWDSWFNSPLSGATASTPIAIDDTLSRYAVAGVPKAKLGMGVSFYAICYTGGISGPRQVTTGATQIVGGDNEYPLSAFFASGSTFDKSVGAERTRDSIAQVPYLSLTTAVNDAHCGASTRYISYDDETSIIAKGAFSKTNGYGGIIIWTLEEGWLPANASGGRAQNALMQALKSGFIDP